MRIEFQERFIPLDEEEIESYRNLKKKIPYEYRRVYLRITDIFAPKEIPGKKEHCLIELYDGSTIIVKGNYDTICLSIDDREKLKDEIEE